MTAMSVRFGSAFSAGPPVLKGVCATIAARAGVPVWVPRTAFVVFGVLHWLLAIILYVVLAKTLCPVARRLAARFTPPTPDHGAARDRFTALDARLAELEAATLHHEAGLRRQFRDLERT